MLKNRKANDQLLPTHTASGKALQGSSNSNTKSPPAVVEKGAAAVSDAPYIASQVGLGFKASGVTGLPSLQGWPSR